MIRRLRGVIVGAAEDHVVLEVGGVGYRVFVPAVPAADPGEETVLHVSTLVREDAFHLFGFASAVDRDLFEILLEVPGVGARTALAVLGTLSRRELADAVARQDVSALKRVPGVGSRTAQRLVVDLAGRIAPEPVELAQPVAVRPDDPLPLALARLGFRRTEIQNALTHLAEAGRQDAPLEERIRTSLQILGGGPGPRASEEEP
ncbi:MAG: Holliday junction branch migration protein RuvA [Deltaproteobacteria bacterium]|nr:Holliday junction branch migration protein RuvA [Deltaproteobacteria bacterium]